MFNSLICIVIIVTWDSWLVQWECRPGVIVSVVIYMQSFQAMHQAITIAIRMCHFCCLAWVLSLCCLETIMGGGVVARRWSFNNWPRDLAHPSPKFYSGLKKCEIWYHFQHQSTWVAVFENAAVYLNSETNLLRCDVRPMSLMEVWSRCSLGTVQRKYLTL